MQAITQDTYGSTNVLKLREVEGPAPGEHEVLVRVRGPASRRRTELFTIIREEFERMHSQIANLPVREEPVQRGLPTPVAA